MVFPSSRLSLKQTDAGLDAHRPPNHIFYPLDVLTKNGDFGFVKEEEKKIKKN